MSNVLLCQRNQKWDWWFVQCFRVFGENPTCTVRCTMSWLSCWKVEVMVVYQQLQRFNICKGETRGQFQRDAKKCSSCLCADKHDVFLTLTRRFLPPCVTRMLKGSISSCHWENWNWFQLHKVKKTQNQHPERTVFTNIQAFSFMVFSNLI